MLIWAALGCIMFGIFYKILRWCFRKCNKDDTLSQTISDLERYRASQNHETPKATSEVSCCARPSPSTSNASTNAYNDPYSDYDVFHPRKRGWDAKSISSFEIDQLKDSEMFMSDPLAALLEAGASNRDIVKTLKRLSSPGRAVGTGPEQPGQQSILNKSKETIAYWF